jgi:hypothetical protein
LRTFLDLAAGASSRIRRVLPGSAEIQLGLLENFQMIPQSCLLIESKKFPIQPGENQEIVNERMYGKALCTYLQEHLPRAGVNVPFFCNEDWGWWLEVEHGDFKMALCIYSDPDAEGNPEKHALMPSIDKLKN